MFGRVWGIVRECDCVTVTATKGQGCQLVTKNLVYKENTNTKSVFGASVPKFLVFSWYFIGILSTIFLNFGLILVVLAE